MKNRHQKNNWNRGLQVEVEASLTAKRMPDQPIARAVLFSGGPSAPTGLLPTSPGFNSLYLPSSRLPSAKITITTNNAERKPGRAKKEESEREGEKPRNRVERAE